MNDAVDWLFVDLNSYFASVEQEVRPELRGRPVCVVPVPGDAACCIAVSYQAKAYGIQTGMRAAEARGLCPHLVFVEARSRLYVEFHHKIAAAIERCVPVEKTMSCDEFACRLVGGERELERAVSIAYAIKRELRTVGETLRCSIGLAPNRLLAKMAADSMKPDGLMLFERRSLPQALYGMELRDVPGIGERMEARLRTAGVSTMRELCGLPREKMHGLWGSVQGDRLWHWLRGEDFLEPEVRVQQTFSRQHVLAPHCRTREAARGIALKLLHATARRLRRNGLWTRGLLVHIGRQGGGAYEGSVRVPACQDGYTLQANFLELWESLPEFTPSDLTVALVDLVSEPERGLFDVAQEARVTPAVDALNARFGSNAVYPGSIHGVRGEAPTRIPFMPPKLEEF